MDGGPNLLWLDSAPVLSRSVRRRLRATGTLLSTVPRVRVWFGPPSALLLAELAGAYAARNAGKGRPVDWAWWATSADLATEAGTLRIDGDLAAWTLGRSCPPAYRVLAGQMVTRYAPYSPGRRLEWELVKAKIADPDVQVIDWGPGHPETLLAVTPSGTGPAG